MACFKQLEHNLWARMREQPIAVALQRVSPMPNRTDINKKLELVEGIKRRGKKY